MVVCDKYYVKTKEKPKYVKKGISYCSKCGKKNNKEIKEFNLENNTGLQKTACSICDKQKPIFLKRV